MTDLRLDWCSYDAAKYACENWHYSGCMPSGKTVKIGVWENDTFIGVIIYSRGATPNLGKPYGLDQSELCELTRIALTDHETPVTRLMSISRKLLTRKCPGTKLVVSFADPSEDHLGTIYQADNWLYTGTTQSATFYEIDGDVKHPRSVVAKYGTSSLDNLYRLLGQHRVAPVEMPGKHRYLYPLDDDIRERVESLAKPYP